MRVCVCARVAELEDVQGDARSAAGNLDPLGNSKNVPSGHQSRDREIIKKGVYVC